MPNITLKPKHTHDHDNRDYKAYSRDHCTAVVDQNTSLQYANTLTTNKVTHTHTHTHTHARTHTHTHTHTH